MAVLQVNDTNGHAPPTLNYGSDLGPNPGVADELDAMVRDLRILDQEMPDVAIRTCMAIMGRLTEISIELVRGEAQDRKKKFLRTSQVQRVMELCDFQFKAASRLVEIARQEVDLSR